MLTIGSLRESTIKSFTKSQKPSFFHGILSRDKSMQKLFDNIRKAAKADVSIHISGETGVGKELVARAVHAESKRSKQPFVAVNVANFSDDLIDSQLFGYKKGAFTGAVNNSSGLMHEAKKGTLFLDEVTCLPTNTQAKLLRVLQERQYYPVGDVHLQEFTASVLSASNQSFDDAVEQNKFREDLRYRLEVIPLYVPPLRERKGDIMLLFQYFLTHISASKEWIIDPNVESQLLNYPWPGNVRELENCAKFSAAMASDTTLTIKNLPNSIQTTSPTNLLFKRVKLTQEIVENALLKNANNRNKTAEFLGVSRMTLWRKMKVYKLL
jgi:transcriptional regulator with PAS, ATPase and Fis domain